MSETKFTPGPWHIHQFFADENCVCIDGCGHVALAQVVWKMEDDVSTPRCEANAHLIAAAPDGYALAELVMDICGNPKGISKANQDQLYETAFQYTKKAQGKS